MKALAQFQESCKHWQYWHTGHNFPGRQAVYKHLLSRHTGDAVIRHANTIKAVCDRAEANS